MYRCQITKGMSWLDFCQISFSFNRKSRNVYGIDVGVEIEPRPKLVRHRKSFFISFKSLSSISFGTKWNFLPQKITFRTTATKLQYNNNNNKTTKTKQQQRYVYFVSDERGFDVQVKFCFAELFFFAVLSCNSLVLDGFMWHFQVSVQTLSRAINKSQRFRKTFGKGGNQTRGCWVRTANATSVLCSPLALLNCFIKLLIGAKTKYFFPHPEGYFLYYNRGIFF